MKIYLRALIAIVPGLAMCFRSAKIRRLALWPWLIGAICYFVSIALAWREHPRLVAAFASDPQGILDSIYFGVVWLTAALLLLGASLIASVLVIQIFTSSFQSAIAAQVLRDRGVAFPEDSLGGVRGTVKEGIRVMGVETGKMLFLLPGIVLVFALGFFPLLIPVAIAGAAWLLAYQFTDIVLDLYKLSVRERFRICAAEKLLLICFGLGLTVLWAIPFAGIFLAPAAAAGCAWLLSESRLLAQAQALSNQERSVRS